MNEDDPRCCGSGTCIIDPEGRCWCGQQWDGEKMVSPPLQDASACGQQTVGSSLPDAG
jgi:hypothetical protein